MMLNFVLYVASLLIYSTSLKLLDLSHKLIPWGNLGFRPWDPQWSARQTWDQITRQKRRKTRMAQYSAYLHQVPTLLIQYQTHHCWSVFEDHQIQDLFQTVHTHRYQLPNYTWFFFFFYIHALWRRLKCHTEPDTGPQIVPNRQASILWMGEWEATCKVLCLCN